MKSLSMKLHLFLTILVLTVVPLAASFVFLNDTLETALGLGFNAEIPKLIASSQADLKHLRTLEPAHEAEYRERFMKAENLKHVYEDRDLLVSSIDGSLKVYFALGLIGALAISIAAALLLSRRISRSYSTVLEEMLKGRERVKALEDLSAWQDTARYLAHEIKNPLTPIEMSFANLERAHATMPADQFAQHLVDTRRMINEELSHLKELVVRFSEFGKTPMPEPEPISLTGFFKSYIVTHGPAWESVDFELRELLELGPAGDAVSMCDRALLRQAVNNIVLNAVEANSDESLKIKISVAHGDATNEIHIANSGRKIPLDVAQKIFQPNFSTKSGARNSGLGLAIVRKIMLEHGGEISYDERDGWPGFTLALPATAHQPPGSHAPPTESPTPLMRKVPE